MTALAPNNDTTKRSDHIETATDAAAFAHWPEGLHADMLQSLDNGCVGSTLVSETDRVRVWHLVLEPGKRCPFHRHVNPYFWSCHTNGKARGYFSDGNIRDVTHFNGETRHFYYGEDEYMLHSVENIGDTPLIFTTVEFIDGPNEPLAVPNSVCLQSA